MPPTADSVSGDFSQIEARVASHEYEGRTSPVMWATPLTTGRMSSKAPTELNLEGRQTEYQAAHEHLLGKLYSSSRRVGKTNAINLTIVTPDPASMLERTLEKSQMLEQMAAAIAPMDMEQYHEIQKRLHGTPPIDFPTAEQLRATFAQSPPFPNYPIQSIGVDLAREGISGSVNFGGRGGGKSKFSQLGISLPPTITITDWPEGAQAHYFDLKTKYHAEKQPRRKARLYRAMYRLWLKWSKK